MEHRKPEEAQRTRRFRPSLSRTLTLGLAGLILVSIGATLWIAIWTAQRNTFELELALAELTVETVVNEVETHIRAAEEQVAFLSGLIERGEVAPDEEQRLADLMIGSLAAAPQVSGIALVRSDYSVFRAGRVEGRHEFLTDDWSGRQEIVESLANPSTFEGPDWRGISYVEEFGEPHIVVAEPVERGSELLGVVFSVVSVGTLSAFLAEFDRISDTRSFILYGEDRVLAHPSLVLGFTGLSDDKPLPLLSEIGDPTLTPIWSDAIDDMGYLLKDTDIGGHVARGPEDDYIYFYTQLEILGGEPWLVGVTFLSSEVDDPLERLILAGSLGLVILLIAVVVGLLVARSIVRPLDRLAGASQAIQSLNLDAASANPLRGSLFKELDIAAKAFDSMVAGLRWFETYVPKALVLRLIRSGGDSVSSEERQVTVLFTDIVGFTRIGAALAPAELATLLNDHFTLLAEAIEAEEGTLDKYIGDSVMAFWGAPLDQPDQAARACRAVQAMARSVRAENRRRRAAGKHPLGLRIGLHTGPALVGNIGAPGRVNYTLIGDTVNIAQRLEGLGKSVDGEAEVVALMTAETRAGLDGQETVEDLGTFDLPGRSGTVAVYRLTLAADAPSDESAP